MPDKIPNAKDFPKIHGENLYYIPPGLYSFKELNEICTNLVEIYNKTTIKDVIKIMEQENY